MAAKEHKERKELLSVAKYTVCLVTFAITMAAWSVRCESTNDSLTFFIVSKQKIEGGSFVNTTNFPKLGFIAAKPDLVVTKLADVFPTKAANFAIVGDGKGKLKAVPTQPPLSLTLKLTAKDSKRFKSLTERAIGNRLLVKLGDKILTAPKVVVPIETLEFGIDFRSEEELKAAEKRLKKLVR